MIIVCRPAPGSGRRKDPEDGWTTVAKAGKTARVSQDRPALRITVGIAALALLASGCVLPGTHYCSIGGHTRDYLFPAPFDVSRGNTTLIDLGFNVKQGGTSVSFMGENETLHVNGFARDFNDPTSNWTLSVHHREMWRLTNESDASPETHNLQARSKALLESEADALLPKFEAAYGAKHESLVDKPAAKMCT